VLQQLDGFMLTNKCPTEQKLCLESQLQIVCPQYSWHGTPNDRWYLGTGVLILVALCTPFSFALVPCQELLDCHSVPMLNWELQACTKLQRSPIVGYTDAVHHRQQSGAQNFVAWASHVEHNTQQNWEGKPVIAHVKIVLSSLTFNGSSRSRREMPEESPVFTKDTSLARLCARVHRPRTTLGVLSILNDLLAFVLSSMQPIKMGELSGSSCSYDGQVIKHHEAGEGSPNGTASQE
jgi:hypothetical protein